MYLMCGLSGAGKTTFAKKFAEENNLIYLSIDDFYKDYGHSQYDEDTGFNVWIEFFKAIHIYEKYRASILIDTNAPTFVKRQQFIDWFPTFNEYNLIYIAIEDEELRKKNNASRGRVVPVDEMERMKKEFEEPVEFFRAYDRVYDCLEKRWDNIIVYRNIDNEFYKCVYNEDLI